MVPAPPKKPDLKQSAPPRPASKTFSSPAGDESFPIPRPGAIFLFLTGKGIAGKSSDMSISSDPSPPYLKIAAIALVALAAFSYGFVPIRASNDVWWHLKTGKIIVERGGRPPANDVFTYTGEKIPWHNHEWLAQVLMYKVFQWGGGERRNLIGLRAVIALKALLLAATFLLVLAAVRLHCPNLPVAALIALLALDVSRRTLYPRPPIFTYLFLAIFLLLLNRWRLGRLPNPALLALPILMLAWANLHGGFIVGLLVGAFFLAGETADFLLERRKKAEGEGGPRTAKPKLRLIWLAATLGACVVASLDTPYGWHLYELPLRVMRASALVKTIAEMRPPLAPETAKFFVSFAAMALLLIGGLIAASVAGRKRPAAADLIVAAFFTYEAAGHIRHLPLFAIATAPIVGWSAGRLLERVGSERSRGAGWAAVLVALVVGCYWAALRERPETYIRRNLRLARGLTYLEYNFPKAACDFIVANRFEGRMFNPINCSGYLIWRLSPETHKLFTDSRFDIFGDRFVWDEWIVRNGIERSDWDKIDWEKVGLTETEGRKIRESRKDAGWRDVLDRWRINFILAERPWPLCRKISTSPEWVRVFTWAKPFSNGREGYEIFVRRTEANRTLIERCLRSAAE